MKKDNRWLYIGGVAILAILVVVGLTWGGSGDQDGDAAAGADGGDESSDTADAAPDDGGDAASPDEASEDDDATDEEEDDDGEDEADAAVVEEVPEDPAECRAYCQRLADRSALANGATAATCAEQLCAADDEAGDGGVEGPPVPTISEPDVPELPDDCQAQCRALQERGELRDGMSLEDCYEALCPSDDEEAEEE